MKKIIVALTLLVTTVAISQSSTASVELEIKKMDQALLYGDKNVAVSKMYNIIAMQGEGSVYKDSLAYLYFNKREFVSCFLVTNDILSRKPENLELLEMNAISLESIGAKEKAAESYTNLLAKSGKAFHAYKLAGLQYETKKLEEAYISIKKAVQLPDDVVVKIAFEINPNYSQDIGLKASIAYLEGVIALGLEKDAEAKAAFERALKLYPDFVLVKSQLSSLNEEKKQRN